MDFTSIRNSLGKLVCRIDKKRKIVEIAIKGCVTTIRFFDDGRIEITNNSKSA